MERPYALRLQMPENPAETSKLKIGTENGRPALVMVSPNAWALAFVAGVSVFGGIMFSRLYPSDQ